MTELAFVCVGNTGQSRLATALAERKRDRRDLGGSVEVVTGGTDPHDHTNDVVEVLREGGIDIEDRTPRRIAADDIADADYSTTMGCAVDDFASLDRDGTAESWGFEHPGGDEKDAVRAQRDGIRNRIADRFDRSETAV